MGSNITEQIKKLRNRANTTDELESIGVRDCDGKITRFPNPSNIKEHQDNDGWLEFDTCQLSGSELNPSTVITRHIRMFRAAIVEYIEITKRKNKGSPVNATYLIRLNGDSGVPTEVALTEFMSRVFDLSKESNCIGHGLSIIRVELGD